MKRLLAAVAILAACSTNQQSSGPAVQVALEPIGSTPDTFYFAGPISLQYQLAVSNPTNQPLTLRRLDLATQGSGAYFLRTSGTLNLRVPANSTAGTNIYAWGRSRGGYLSSGEPVMMRGTALFEDAAGHTFAKVFMQNLSVR